MPTVTLETQLFAPVQRVGHTPQPPLSGAAPPSCGCLSHSWRQCKTFSSHQCATGCGVAVIRRPRRPPLNPTVAAACLCRRLPPAQRRRDNISPPTCKNASCDHAPRWCAHPTAMWQDKPSMQARKSHTTHHSGDIARTEWCGPMRRTLGCDPALSKNYLPFGELFADGFLEQRASISISAQASW